MAVLVQKRSYNHVTTTAPIKGEKEFGTTENGVEKM